MMVHPEQDDQSIQEQYGLSPDDQAAFAGFLPAPLPTEVTEARQALAHYRHAVNSGDLNTAQQLTSQLLNGWSASRQDFLTYNALRGGDEAAPNSPQTTLAMRLMPRAAVAMIVASLKGGASRHEIWCKNKRQI